MGARLNLKTLQNNQGYRLLTMDNDKKLRELIMGEYAFRDKTHESIRRLKRVPLVLVIVGFFTASLRITSYNVCYTKLLRDERNTFEPTDRFMSFVAERVLAHD